MFNHFYFIMDRLREQVFAVDLQEFFYWQEAAFISHFRSGSLLLSSDKPL